MSIAISSSLAIVNALNSSRYIDPCAQAEEIVKPRNCGEIPHCPVDPSQYENFCFNGTVIQDEGAGANQLLMTFLCTGIDFPLLPDSGMDFGSCAGDEELIYYREDESEVICRCDRDFKQNKMMKCFSVLKEI